MARELIDTITEQAAADLTIEQRLRLARTLRAHALTEAPDQAAALQRIAGVLEGLDPPGPPLTSAP